MSQRNVVSWKTMIPCDGIHGLSEEASTLFKQMQLACMKPDDIKFVVVLCPWIHARMVDEGSQLVSKDSNIICQLSIAANDSIISWDF
jgi:pentatricopeptide repeat protein